ncbi:threonine--tRNA ligase [Candidatus Woesebacteria bacterium RIFCSPHIGHO2_01_FULL_39_17]|uniref:Threonine--tRNA ligase n=3 Tax=Candidatus Woeseibacteriota TaxID=1752722 RepID=A0A0G0RKR2_9BACT|nr:MAG: Threonine-tRNA ligase [Microgenomates group bacterium GW2011_GWC1_38_12]KKQ94285.1 MAG: Threonine-tRNA ligase [Candidatus Woesebacteria bacterium GW2011_GWB1_39_10b]KKR14222.1 MAG: Threonine-tRNA ligase [Candidatus Woesebacteria bacterium GW2011_GWA1_39_21b]OGM22639.1 MAG: threonine--tRNA ligase [Candidatus Woesebacteria bacterium RIFCSPHIGHO2_01_FULL_39_17]OGM63592.1 MAG: threonine--tRNA ligase [Candidatus Woesebacteria bacterium RIFCSPLOWO2_01_FULL_39_14]
MKSQKNLDNLRHSTSHLLAAALLEIYPDSKPTLGPPIEDGFYYDFDNLKISEEDLPKIEEKMREILPSWKNFERHELKADDAKKEYPKNPYKHEMIEEFSEKGKKKVSFYKSGDYWDLCRGGHVEHPDKELQHFKLLSIAGAYWRGSEKNPMLTRIYGTVFPTQKELDEYLKNLELEKERDHRKIGKELDLFVFSDLVGAGLPLFTEKGAAIRRELERFVQDEEIKRGYKHVITPPLAKTDLYKTSGHYPYYKDTMYPPMVVDEDELILRPMTCPHHFMLYKSRPRSYKELPLRIAELASQFRYEKSGELSGLMRVRMFCLADAHIVSRVNQAEVVIKEVLELIDYISEALGLEKGKDYRYRLSLGDRNDDKKYYKDDKAWDKAEETLRKVLKETKSPFFEAEGEAAFYGPKIDVQMKKISGKEETAFTVQYDFVMPKRFDLTYVNEKGAEEQPIVIHRSSIGAIERVMALLIEKFNGNFPTWLTPIQVKVLPISTRHIKYAEEIVSKLKEGGIRVELDDRNATLPAKIRDSQMEKVSYMLVVGDKEQEKVSVRVRVRSGEDHGMLKLEEFIKDIRKEIDEKIIN